jgi:hypothetical protein
MTAGAEKGDRKASRSAEAHDEALQGEVMSLCVFA